MSPYRYFTKHGTPLVRCPHCRQDLTAPDGLDVTMHFDDGFAYGVPTRMLSSGEPFGMEELLEHGRHIFTACGRCFESLGDWEVEDLSS